MKGEDEIINIISTSRKLVQALQDKPDSFITATLNGEEYVIESIQMIPTHANIDDTVMHWTLNLREGGKNVKR